jgi:hypothetical protein
MNTFIEYRNSYFYVDNQGNVSKTGMVTEPKIAPDGSPVILIEHQFIPVAQMVAEAFIRGYSEFKHEIRHVDGDITNNKVENLEICPKVKKDYARPALLFNQKDLDILKLANRYEVLKNGRVIREDGKLIKSHSTTGGYLTVKLAGRQRLVHRLVAEKHIPNPNGLPYVHFIDGNRANCDASNLEWSANKAYRENTTPPRDKKSHGPRPVVHDATGVTYTSATEAAKEHGIHPATVFNYCNRTGARDRKGALYSPPKFTWLDEWEF